MGEPVPVGFQGAAAGATTGVMADKRIYVFGGTIDTSQQPCNLTQVYDPETNVWSIGTPMPIPKVNFGVAVVNDEIYVIRNNMNEKYTPTDYIPEFPSWAILPLLLVATLAALICRKLTQRAY